MKTWSRYIGIVVLTLVPGLVPAWARAQDTAAKIDEYMAALVKLDRFSGAILVSKNTQVIRSAGYKFANAEWQMPNGTNTKFRIGSLTKQFTAMAVMILQEGGKLHTADPICQFLEGCPQAWKPITIRQLLTHTSGIPDYVNFPDFAQTQALAATPHQLIVRFRNKPLDFVPGEKFSYSNSGYVLLGVIIEKVSGETYADFVQHHIFAPLKMTGSGYDNAARVELRRASGYAKEGQNVVNARYIDPSVAYAAGALYSTVEDLLLWDNVLYTDTLVSKKSLEEIFTPTKDIVGYGWAIGTLFDRLMQHHNGSIDGFVSNVARFPNERVLVVVLANRDGIPVDNITKDLAAIVFGEKYELPKERRTIQLRPEASEKYVGDYQITPDIRLTITLQGQRFFGQISGSESGKFELFVESTTKFFSETPPVELDFTLDANGKASYVVVNGQFRGKRVR
jgi:CubicO group peptidase (beta-lactamase class C family)